MCFMPVIVCIMFAVLFFVCVCARVPVCLHMLASVGVCARARWSAPVLLPDPDVTACQMNIFFLAGIRMLVCSEYGHCSVSSFSFSDP